MRNHKVRKLNKRGKTKQSWPRNTRKWRKTKEVNFISKKMKQKINPW